jgi:3-hydroxybutyryl-CoA dehydrogenase
MSETVTAKDIRKVAVIGAGTMGHGIAQICAMAGFDVMMRDVEESLVRRGEQRIRSNLDKGIARGKVTDEQRDSAMARIGCTTRVAEAVANADVVIEAAPEILDLKQTLFREVDEAAPARALFGTNTSSLSVAAIASAVANPNRVIGMHFFNPVHIMKLLEIVHHDGNSHELIDATRSFGETIGKSPVVVRDVPGFASSRLGIAIGLEAMRMVEEEVASAADIDTAMKLGYGHPMGPLELTDLVGLDIRLHIADYLAEAIGPRFRPPEILRSKVDEGKLGKKSGEGFYRWQDGKRVD